jgi:urease accessory protein
MGARLFQSRWILGGLAAALASGPALAHHPMGGTLPGTLSEGLLSGFGHPVIGLDHLAAVIAVGCLAAFARNGIGLVIGYVLAMVIGAAVHVQGVTIPAAEALVALSVVALGAFMIWSRQVSAIAMLALFAIVGLLHGYALGESIVGAERTPLFAYFAGLAVIQTAIGLGAMFAVRLLFDPAARPLMPLRLVGAAVAAVGIVVLLPQLMS